MVEPTSTSQAYLPHYDAIIVGGRCAGASTAMLLARAGARVLLIDRQGYGTDRISTHALMRAGVLQLHRWGLLERIIDTGTPPVRRTTLHYGNDVIPIDIKPDQGVDFLCAPRRTLLDRLLVDAARAAGADVRHDVSLVGLCADEHGRVCGARIRENGGSTLTVKSGIVVGADGRQSLVARLVKAGTYIESRYRSSAVYGYFSNLDYQGFNWFYQQGKAAGAIPTNDGQHCVFACVPPEEFSERFREDIGGGFLQAIAETSPELREKMGSTKLGSRFFAFAGMPGFFRHSHGPGWALVGDAGYYKDPLTAHGITDALRDAELLSRAILQGGENALALYQATRDELSMRLFELTDEIASLMWDMDTIKSLHTQLQTELKREFDHLAGFPEPVLKAA